MQSGIRSLPLDDDAIVVIVPKDGCGNERDKRIQCLKARAAGVANGRMVVYESGRLMADAPRTVLATVIDLDASAAWHIDVFERTSRSCT
jgi:hypothetical protein